MKQSKKEFVNQLNGRMILQAISKTAIVAITDPKGRILEVNDLFCQISGYDREELIEQDHRMLNSGYHPKEFFQEMWKTIKSGNSWVGEIQNRKKNGKTYWVLTSITPIFDSSNQIEKFISIRFDVTARYEAQSLLVQASKMVALGEMTAGISHEINNPLAIIEGKVHLLHKKIKNSQFNLQECLTYLESIQFVTGRISKIVKGMKDFSRKSDFEPMKATRVSEIIDCIQELTINIVRNRTFEIKCIEIKDVYVNCRPYQLEQVLICLISNANDALKPRKDGWVRLDVECLNENVVFKVTDSGQAIPEDVIQKMMQPFFTTKEPGKGTGLGLSISKGLVEDHGGRLYYNKHNNNTQFVVELPILELQTSKKIA